MQFWLDTIGEWEKETCHKPLVALSCTRDVQDAILADPVRNALVDVVDFRYWWQTRHGIFAPAGGKNLAPRQFERQWRGGRPTDQDLAAMAAEYRRRFPAKAVICNFDTARWAFLCAGGSLPRLPRSTELKLLEAIPLLRPWQADTSKEFWALRAPGKNYLMYSGTGREVMLDLTGEQGEFIARIVTSDGTLAGTGQRVQAGPAVRLTKASDGAAVFWLERR
jgi:hypothetical protein